MAGFYGRKAELQTLEDLYHRGGNQGVMAVVYGQRRIGKTCLLSEWVKTRLPKNARGFGWFFEIGTPAQQLAQFSRAVGEFTGLSGISFKYWGSALKTLAASAGQRERLVIIIDEFTSLLASNPNVSSQFQKTWDLELKQSNVMLVICGSDMGMMRDHFFNQQAPLYGRAHNAICLTPFSFGHTKAYFSQYEADRRMSLYSILGGVPGYWDRINPAVSLRDNILNLLLTRNSPMRSEPRLLIHDHVREPETFVSILRAISQGHRTFNNIIKAAGVSGNSISYYLNVMQDAKLIKRQLSVTTRKGSKIGSRYRVIDPFLRFYYRFLEPRMWEIELGITKPSLEIIERHLADFIDANTWEEVCREWLVRVDAGSRLPFFPGEVGAAWNSRVQIDVAAINSEEGIFTVGECKWTRTREDVQVIEKLLRQIPKILPGGKHWRVQVLGFSRSGWTRGVHYPQNMVIPTQQYSINYTFFCTKGIVFLTVKNNDYLFEAAHISLAKHRLSLLHAAISGATVVQPGNFAWKICN